MNLNPILFLLKAICYLINIVNKKCAFLLKALHISLIENVQEYVRE